MAKTTTPTLSYLITVSREHLMPAVMLVRDLKLVTNNEIVAVGNLSRSEAKQLSSLGCRYIDEDDIDMSGRLPQVSWQEKYRGFGWYKQMFIRHSIDRFMDTDQVILLDSEVFPFENWDEKRFYDPASGQPRSFYWVPKQRKPDWDYQMYRGAAYLLSFLPGFEDVMEYANSDGYQRHISGVVQFSTKNVAHLWKTLSEQTDLEKNLADLFSKDNDMAFSDHDIYGIAAEYGLFDEVEPTTMYNGLLGWYDNHSDPNFADATKNPMWSMNQSFRAYPDVVSYHTFMTKTAKKLSKKLPVEPYWNKPDRSLIDTKQADASGVSYFKKYKQQLNFTERTRFETMYEALRLLCKTPNPVIAEIGTLRDDTKGGGHSTYKFGEFCERFGGHLHTVDILEEAIDFSKAATKRYEPWISYHLSDSEAFFESYDGKPINLLYLDGFDSTPGMESEASKKQLAEIDKALSLLSEQSLVLLDDADLPERGKTRFSSEYLLSHGFDLIVDSYQQLYARGYDVTPVKKAKSASLFARLKNRLS